MTLNISVRTRLIYALVSKPFILQKYPTGSGMKMAINTLPNPLPTCKIGAIRYLERDMEMFPQVISLKPLTVSRGIEATFFQNTPIIFN